MKNGARIALTLAGLLCPSIGRAQCEGEAQIIATVDSTRTILGRGCFVTIERFSHFRPSPLCILHEQDLLEDPGDGGGSPSVRSGLSLSLPGERNLL